MINDPSVGGVLFEYGGAPRKMLPGIAALTRLFGVPQECVKIIHREDLRAYVFRDKDRAVAVTWCNVDQKRSLTLAPNVRAYDIMGNEISPHDVVVTESPIYLLSTSADAILQSL